jgi:predicted dehydrogenase
VTPNSVGVVGLNYWGPNLVRNFDGISDLRWVCDLDAEQLDPIAARYPNARPTTNFDDLLADDTLDAVVIATPVPTHYVLAKQALEAGKHVFVEKPPAMRSAEMDELVSLADAQDRVLMPGHLLLYHPGVLKVKELIDNGELGEILCVYGNRVNLGIVRSNENALWSLGVHDLSVILYLLDEDPELATAQGSASIHPGVEDVVFCFLRFPSGRIAHMHLSWLDPHKMRKMTVVGREKMVVFDDMEPERKVTVYEKRAGPAGELYSGDISIPKVPTAEPLRLECTYFIELIDGKHDKAKVARDGARVVRALEMLTTSLAR